MICFKQTVMLQVINIFCIITSTVAALTTFYKPRATFCGPQDQFYREIGCNPVSTLNGCPIKYNCPSFATLDSSKCHYNRDLVFNEGEKLDKSIAENLCRPDCYCDRRLGTEYAYFVCTHYDCFERSLPDCVAQFTLDSCCSKGQVCKEDRNNLAKCYVDGKEYLENQKIYPEAFPCHKCLCGTNYSNETVLNNPNCKEIQCGYGLKTDNLKRGCVPIFFGEKSCCAINWKCPEDYDSVIKSSESASVETCTFGKLTLSIGDTVDSDSEDVICTCSVPPFVNCIQKPTSY